MDNCRRKNKKVVILAVLLMCIVIPFVSATNYYNYVFNGTMWVPMLSTSDGQKKIWLEMKNCSYGNVQEDLVVGGNVDVEGNITLGQKITFVLGEIIDNIVDGWVRITGGLNVTGNLDVGGDVNVSGDLNVTGDVTAPKADSMIKAWVNFDGTTNVGGLCTIRDSYNVVNVTDNGIGDYTVYWDTDFANDGYALVGSCSDRHLHTQVVSVGSCNVMIDTSADAAIDVVTISMIAIGDQ